MTIQTIVAQDATGTNEPTIPGNILACGYDTGSDGIAWTAEQFAARTSPYPAIHIDQDPSASDTTADILDVESGAATIAEIPGWIIAARASYNAHVRPGQRWPGIYCDSSNLTLAVDALTAAKITDVPFWIAEDETLSTAIAQIQSATGSYPRIGVQYASGTTVDYDIFNLSWVTTISGDNVTDTQNDWAWCPVCKSLFFAPDIEASKCAGTLSFNVSNGALEIIAGPHTLGNSYNYSLTYTDTTP